MNLNNYLNEFETAASLAKKLGVHASLVSQWRTGARPIPEIWCVALERETGNQVTRKDTRPKDWHLIWPELEKNDLDLKTVACSCSK